VRRTGPARPIEVLAKLRAARSNRAIAALENAEVE